MTSWNWIWTTHVLLFISRRLSYFRATLNDVHIIAKDNTNKQTNLYYKARLHSLHFLSFSLHATSHSASLIKSPNMLNNLKLSLILAIVWIGSVHSRLPGDTSKSVNDRRIKSAVFKSPAFTLGPGEVQDKYYHGIDFPRGHIALKSFNAEVVDEMGNSVPLNEVYLHHWVVERFYHKHPLTELESMVQNKRLSGKNYIIAKNDGICDSTLNQYFGLGSETRRTSTFVPDPYGIVVGNAKEIPDGYEESWLLNVHAIDTRGVENSLGCTECRCDLYNVTTNEHGRPLKKNYKGGLFCCYDGTQCQLKEGVQKEKRTRYLKYTIQWVDKVDTVTPVRVYILDVTDSGERSRQPGEYFAGCKVEYDVPSCSTNESIEKCHYTRETQVTIPKGGNIIYAVSHQHTGGNGSVLYGQDGREICSSEPIYGQGIGPGNEEGYIVGMNTCYPEPGSIKVYDGEKLTLQSTYTKDAGHTGVMGLFYLLVAENSTSNYVTSM